MANLGPAGMTNKRVTKEQWLQGALDFIIEHGVFGMTPDRLARSLGTSRSSYYWHFDSQKEFRARVVDYWIRKCTNFVAEQLTSLEGRPEDRFDLLFDLIQQDGITRYEGAVHALAYGDSCLTRKIEEAYLFRQEFLESTLKEIGIRADRRGALSRLLLCFFTWETEMGFSRSRQIVKEHRQLVSDLLIVTDSPDSTSELLPGSAPAPVARSARQACSTGT